MGRIGTPSATYSLRAVETLRLGLTPARRALIGDRSALALRKGGRHSSRPRSHLQATRARQRIGPSKPTVRASHRRLRYRDHSLAYRNVCARGLLEWWPTDTREVRRWRSRLQDDGPTHPARLRLPKPELLTGAFERTSSGRQTPPSDVKTSCAAVITKIRSPMSVLISLLTSYG